ncbi:MAG: hypothetical protein IJ060_05955 [Oscillospiraceae bacterium]|nr:hypothetical protein [Oscillospiraceae bacterium]
MKRFAGLSVLAAALLLTGCGETNTESIDGIIAAQEQSSAAQPEAPQETEEVPAASAESIAERSDESIAESSAESIAESSAGDYDVDLTGLDGNMVYAQVYDMLYGETDYIGKSVRAKGTFSYYKDGQTQQEYFAVVISDGAGCCAQGIEFVLAGDYTYPEDYPELGDVIVIHGIFNTYKDETGTYVQLRDAVLESA